MYVFWWAVPIIILKMNGSPLIAYQDSRLGCMKHMPVLSRNPGISVRVGGPTGISMLFLGCTNFGVDADDPIKAICCKPTVFGETQVQVIELPGYFSL